MDQNKNNWHLLSLPFYSDLQDALKQQYQASQFLAMVGKYLVPQREDDSNTNFIYHPESHMFIGNELHGRMKIGLDLNSLDLLLLNHDNLAISTIRLAGQTITQAFIRLKQLLVDKGIKSDNLKNELHYDLPDHLSIHESVFTSGDHKSMQELIAQRHNANLALIRVTDGSPGAEPVRIWPHHFDTGSLLQLSHNSSGQLTGSIGIGWAIPDTMIDEPYFYLSYWSEEQIKLPSDISSLSYGRWMIPDWNGGVLALSEILEHNTEEKQMDAVLSFFSEGINIIHNSI